MPNEIDLYALNYNKALFEEAGIDGPPTTWDELIAAAEALTVRDGDTITQQGFGLINSWAAGVVHPFASLLASNGGELIGEDGMPALDTPQALETFELYENLVSGVQVTDPTMGTADANTHRPVPRQLRRRQHGDDHHGQLVGVGAAHRHGRRGVRQHRHRADPGRAERRVAVEHLLLVDDRRQRRRRARPSRTPPGTSSPGSTVPTRPRRRPRMAPRRWATS